MRTVRPILAGALALVAVLTAVPLANGAERAAKVRASFQLGAPGDARRVTGLFDGGDIAAVFAGTHVLPVSGVVFFGLEPYPYHGAAYVRADGTAVIAQNVMALDATGGPAWVLLQMTPPCFGSGTFALLNNGIYSQGPATINDGAGFCAP